MWGIPTRLGGSISLITLDAYRVAHKRFGESLNWWLRGTGGDRNRYFRLQL